MLKKAQAVLALFGMATYAAATTPVLGTASARGEMRVDGYAVNGNATVFNGSTIETGDASADLRVAHGIDITLSKSSRGIIYPDRFVLQHGETELTSAKSFELQANGLDVASKEPNSMGVVRLTPNNAVEVEALTGSFEVKNSQGTLLSNVIPGKPLQFAMQAQASSNPYSVSMVGILDSENGRYYLTTDENVKYELTGQNLQKFVGDKVVISGTLQPAVQTSAIAGTVTVESIQINGGNNTSRSGEWLIVGASVAGAGAVGWVIYNAEQSPASK